MCGPWRLTDDGVGNAPISSIDDVISTYATIHRHIYIYIYIYILFVFGLLWAADVIVRSIDRVAWCAYMCWFSEVWSWRAHATVSGRPVRLRKGVAKALRFPRELSSNVNKKKTKKIDILLSRYRPRAPTAVIRTAPAIQALDPPSLFRK